MSNKYRTADGMATCVRVSEKSSQLVETNLVSSLAKFEDIEKEKASDLLSPVCCFTVSSDNTQQANEKYSTNFPPTISVIIDPPSPSMSIGSHHEINLDYKLDPQVKQYSGSSMERCRFN